MPPRLLVGEREGGPEREGECGTEEDKAEGVGGTRGEEEVGEVEAGEETKVEEGDGGGGDGEGVKGGREGGAGRGGQAGKEVQRVTWRGARSATRRRTERTAYSYPSGRASEDKMVGVGGKIVRRRRIVW